ncbi:putative Lipase 2 [Glarea lozoyensis 74030]|uniref:Putative Lipase 2 n=1 Tax=Glarea lozoyensis (strain ATCC 74030 / MF5533) TaxID=1104152 RepID=H0ERL2_GLAL7|nr:putative Lipase 2 [Glarea lozoyensis 74030]
MYLSNLSYVLGCLPLLATAALSKRQNSTAPTVQVLNGSYYGVHSQEYSQDYFLGIPFARPPVGDLRFRPPQSLNTTFNDTRNATEYSPACIGYGSDTWVLGNYISEDCLTVNVIRPEGVAPGTNLPVAGCSNATDTLACLRTIPTDTLSSILNSTVTTGFPWGPQVDNDFLLAPFPASLQAGNFVRVPILTGRNHDEGTDFAPKGINTTDQFLANVRSQGPDNATAVTIAALYPDIPAIGIPATLDGRPTGPLASYGVQWKRISSYIGDLRQHVPRRIVNQVWSKYNVTNYSYHFNVIPNGAGAWLGSGHFREVAFVFDNTDGLGYKNVVAVNPFEGKGEEFFLLARLMSRMWVSFITGGSPNDSGVSCVNWPEYTLENPRNMVFDVNVTKLAYVEPDTYRAEGIQYLADRFADVYNR